jgi:FKBP-type peptidyl-prolyl cis-trans isomerase
MKFSVTLAASLVFVTCVTAIAQTNAAAPDQRTLLTAFGWQLANEEHLAGMDINDRELTNFLNGFSIGAQGQHLPPNDEGIFPDVDALAKVRQKRVIDAIARRNAAAAQNFLNHWKESAAVTNLPDGVFYEILTAGNGTFARPTQTVNVHYIARLINGAEITEFDPGDIILVTNHLNVGLFEGFQKIGVGGKMKLYLPPALAAEQVEIAGAQPGSALVYEVEILGVRDTPAGDLADELVSPAPDPPPPAYSGRFATNNVIKAWGWQIAERRRLWRLLLSDDELTNFLAGLEAGVRGQPLSFDAVKCEPEIDQFVSERRDQYQLTFKQKQIAAMNALFDKLDRDTNVTKLPDGLHYQILQPGDRHLPKRGQIVLVNYTGQTLDGHVFDQTVNEPLHVEVGRVIPGWSEGIQKIGVGGKIKLYIPPSLGYGGDAVSGIPADSTLVYDIDLLAIEETPK